MTVLTLALLAGSHPAAPRLAPVHQIGPQSRRQSPHTPCAPLVRTDALTLTWQKADRHKRSAQTSSSHTPWPNPHSACGTAAAPLPAISCLGAFRPPAARARGEVRHCRQPKTCTQPAVSTCSKIHGAVWRLGRRFNDFADLAACPGCCGCAPRNYSTGPHAIGYRQRGSLQLFSSLKTASTRSLPQILFPALLGCSRKVRFRSAKYASIANLHPSTDP